MRSRQVATPWSEDALAAAQADAADNAQGCDQLAVVISQHRQPGFGSLATSSDLVSPAFAAWDTSRPGPGGYAPAMLLLKRTGWPVLTGGSASGSSFIHVRGSVADSNNVSQPGTVHSDSDGEGCSGGSNSNVFLGKGGRRDRGVRRAAGEQPVAARCQQTRGRSPPSRPLMARR